MAQLTRVEEWVGGTLDMPSYVVGEEGGPYRPQVLLWVVPNGPVVGNTMVPRDVDPVAACVDSFRSATRAPLAGRPHEPTRVRVASEEIAAALRLALPAKIEVVCAPTPELDEVAEGLRAYLKDKSGSVPSYLAKDIGPGAVASFFRAAARLHRAAPWKVVPDDTSIIAVTIDALDLKDAVISVIGQMGQSFAVILFASREAFEAHLDMAEAAGNGEMPSQVAPHVAINFDRGADIEPELRKEIAEHGWEVAGSNAYPWLVAVDEDIVGRGPTAREQTIMEAIAIALAEWIESEPKLGEAWGEAPGAARTFVTPTHAGKVEVALSVVPSDTRDALLARFANSPEALALAEPPNWADLMLHYASDYLDVPVDRIRRKQLEEIVFEIIPHKVSCAPREAAPIVAELRAFWAFADRELGLPNAKECLRALGRDAAKELEEALSDPANFGMAKSIFMAGQEMGFDVHTPEGMQKFVSTMNAAPRPSRAALPSATAKAKKAKRKQASASRRKNR